MVSDAQCRQVRLLLECASAFCKQRCGICDCFWWIENAVNWSGVRIHLSHIYKGRWRVQHFEKGMEEGTESHMALDGTQGWTRLGVPVFDIGHVRVRTRWLARFKFECSEVH